MITTDLYSSELIKLTYNCHKFIDSCEYNIKMNNVSFYTSEIRFKVRNPNAVALLMQQIRRQAFFIELQVWHSQELKSHHPSNLWYKSMLATENIGFRKDT